MYRIIFKYFHPIRMYSEIKESLRHNFLYKKKSDSIRLHLTEKKIIILASDCVGGRLMKDFNLPFYTPTVNIWYPNDDFLKLCKNPDFYFKQPLIEKYDSTENCPVATCADITLVFGHYKGKSFDEINKIWKKGCKSYFRAKNSEDYEIIVIANDRNGFEPYIEEFSKLPYKYKIVFTHKKNNHKDCFYMNGEDSYPYVKTMTDFENMFSLHRRYDRFDFYSWFKEIYNLK